MIENVLKQRALNFPTRKQLGQNFLVNEEMLSRIAQELQLQSTDEVIEIGPGLGFLTQFLVSKAKNITAIELDPYCIEALKKLALPNLTIIEADFLQFDLSKIIVGPTKIVGNIPYNITTPIISKLLGEIGEPAPWLKDIQSIVLTVQRELADRLIAKPGKKDYSQITLLMNYYGLTKLLFTIGPENFTPPPKVHSAVIQFTPYEKCPVTCEDHKLLRQVIKTAFAKRRKMLKNNLRSLHMKDTVVSDIFRELNFDPQTRAESLNLEQFAQLTDAIDKTMG